MDIPTFNMQPSESLVYAYAFDGPNLYRPGPGVALGVLSEHDQQQQISLNLKQLAMRVGIVIGQLSISSIAHSQGILTRLDFATPTPGIALEVACLAVAASIAGKEHSPELEEALWQAQQRRRSEALPLWAVQILAEARRRRIPAFRWQQGLQLGYGTRGMYIAVDQGAPSAERILPESIGISDQGSKAVGRKQPIDWSKLGSVPLIAISGGDTQQRHDMAERLLEAKNIAADSYTLLVDGSFEDIRRRLVQADTQAAIMTLHPSMLLTRGLPFEECQACVILKPVGQQSEAYVNGENMLRAIGLPLLVTDPQGIALFLLETEQANLLGEYAPCETSSQLQLFLSRL